MDKNLWDNLFAESYDGERLQITHKIYKDDFQGVVEQILAEYGLGERLAEAITAGAKLDFLDIGCAEGLFLHDLAALLETKGWLEAVNLTGLDKSATSIATAEEFSRISQPPRPYLHFITHDATQPFELNPELRVSGRLRFDFIYMLATLETIPQAKENLLRFYDYLKPGGVIFVRSIVTQPGEMGWLPAHPALEPFQGIIYRRLAGVNGEVDVANSVAEWLRETGAAQLTTAFYKTIVGGPTERGRLALRNSLMVLNNIRPVLIKEGLITQAGFDGLMEKLYRELTPQSQGQTAAVVTIARKPD